MTRRATLGDLERLLALVNCKEGRPLKPYLLVDGEYTPQGGCLHLSGAYGGWKVDMMCDQGTGTRHAMESGFVPKSKVKLWLEGRLSAADYEGEK